VNLVLYILIGGLVVRTLLDLSTLTRSSPLISALYTILYGGLGSVILIDDHTNVFGYLTVIIGLGWALHGIYLYKVNLRNKQSHTK
jgi:hypothetical protein